MLGDEAVYGLDLGHHRISKTGQQVPVIFHVHLFGERYRTDEVTEHHRQLPSFGLADCWLGWLRRRLFGDGRCRRLHWRIRRLSGLGREIGNGFQNAFSMTQRGNAQVLQVIVGKFRKQIDLYGIVFKRLRVLLQAEGSQPPGHIRHDRGLDRGWAGRAIIFSMSAGSV